MSRARRQPDARQLTRLDDVVGYLNYSSGASDARFLANINELFRDIDGLTSADEQPVDVLCRWLDERMDHLSATVAAFADVEQARSVTQLLQKRLLSAYRTFHRDLLCHQSERDLWRPLFVGRAFEALLEQGGPWNETERIVVGALDMLNDYLGYRPIAVLESERPMEPYRHERVRPIPLYIQGVGVATGPYEELVQHALSILRETDPDILHQAWFDLELLEELALDPRAYDFDHPASKRPNHHFGQWDLHHVDNRGFYRRFVVQQVTLDALLWRVNPANGNGGRANAGTREERLFEAAAVLAGTILMASGTSGNGPGCHSSDVTLSTLLPLIAAYRDQFYHDLLERFSGPHGERLRDESRRLRQPFGGVRQHLNHELARRRAAQMQHVHLARLYARMGYPDAARKEADEVRTASARILCQIYCLLTVGHQSIDARQLDAVARYLPEIDDLLKRGIECGALVDPWTIVGFGGNYSLFPAIENTIHDLRVDDLIELMEQIFDLCARAWTEAAAVDDAAQEAVFSATLERLANWWDKFATASVSGVKRLVGKECEISTNLVAGALSAWHKAGAAAGDVRFWRMFVDQFDTPKAFQLVIEALLERGDQVASMALMLQWVSQVDRTPLEDGDASFHALALRWLRAVDAEEQETGVDQWPLAAKFLAHLEASAELYWQVPEFELSSEPSDAEDETLEPGPSDTAAASGPDAEPPAEEDGLEEDAPEEDEYWDDSEADELYSAAYEDMVYRDSTDDGRDASLIDSTPNASEVELEEEAQRLGQRLEFLATVARLWRLTAITWGAEAAKHTERCQTFLNWYQQASARCEKLEALLEAAHRYPIPKPVGSHESMVEFDRRRMVKDSLLEQLISTGVEMATAGRFMRAAASMGHEFAGHQGSQALDGASAAVLRGVMAGDGDDVLRHWPRFARWLATQELLYVPLSKGGRPRRIVRARSLGQLLEDLLGWLPRLGLLRETCQLLDIAQAAEINHPVGPGAVTEYDRLFTRGYQAIVRALVASADDWDTERGGDTTADAALRDSDTMLVEALQDLTESQLSRWLTHSHTLRLSVVERLAPDAEWHAFVAFVERYGADLFTQQFLGLGNLRAILHNRTSVWLSNLEQNPEAEDLRLVAELGTAISHEEASKWLTIAIEAVVENYREYRDYNSTTTQSDHGELLYTLIDFLRLRAAYDRVAWNLRPVVMAHEILVRHNRPAAAELWQRALAERTAEAAEAHLARFEQLCDQYGIRLPSIAERLGECYTRPLSIDRVRALVGPAVATDQNPDPAPFQLLRQEIASLMQEPAGAGLDLPDWLAALEDEVSAVRCKLRSHQHDDDCPRHIGQICLKWDDWQRQIADDAS